MKSSCLKTTVEWDATQAEAMICQSTQELFPQGMFGSCGNQVKTTNVNTHASMDADVPLQHPLQQDGSFNRKSEFRKAENLKEPVTKGE